MLGASLIEHVDELRRLCGCYDGQARMCDACAESVLAVVFEDWTPDRHDRAPLSDVLTAGTMPDALVEPIERVELVSIRHLNFGSPQYESAEMLLYSAHELTFAARFAATTPGITQHVTYTTTTDRAVSYFKTTP